MKNGGFKENWYALYASIKGELSSTEALVRMGLAMAQEKTVISNKKIKAELKVKSVAEIAEAAGVHRDTIYKRLRSMPPKQQVSEAEFRELYKKYKVREIARIICRGTTTVYELIKKYNLRPEIDRNRIKEMYTKEMLSYNKIGKQYQISDVQVMNILKEMGVKARSRRQAANAHEKWKTNQM